MKERWPEMLEYQQKVQAMTDLERAREIERQLHVWDADHTADRWITLLMLHLAAARREGVEAERAANAEAKDAIVHIAMAQGAKEMRERAARICDLDDCVRIKASALAADIRALSLTPEKPA